MNTSTEKYVNTPLNREVYAALKTRATENGRPVGRELANIAARALKRSPRKPEATK